MLVLLLVLPVLPPVRLCAAGLLAALFATLLGSADLAIPAPAPLRMCVDAEKMRLLAVPATRDTILIVLGTLANSAIDQMGLATAAGDAIAHATTPTIHAVANGNWTPEPATTQLSR